MKKILFLLTLCLTLTGCGFVETIIPPKTTLPHAVADAAKEPAVTSGPEADLDEETPNPAPSAEDSAEQPVQETAEITLPILDEIRLNVRVATAGGFSTAVTAAENMLDWGCYTGLDPEEIRLAAQRWKDGQDEETLSLFHDQLRTVDEVYLMLVGQDGQPHDENGAWAWGRERVDAIEVIMEVFELRG